MAGSCEPLPHHHTVGPALSHGGPAGGVAALHRGPAGRPVRCRGAQQLHAPPGRAAG